MSEAKHSDLPWRHEGGFQVWTEDGDIVAHCDRSKDAAFIVKACNAHDKLVAALEKAEELYKAGLLNAPHGLANEVVKLRRDVLSSLKENPDA